MDGKVDTQIAFHCLPWWMERRSHKRKHSLSTFTSPLVAMPPTNLPREQQKKEVPWMTGWPFSFACLSQLSKELNAVPAHGCCWPSYHYHHHLPTHLKQNLLLSPFLHNLVSIQTWNFCSHMNSGTKPQGRNKIIIHKTIIPNCRNLHITRASTGTDSRLIAGTET